MSRRGCYFTCLELYGQPVSIRNNMRIPNGRCLHARNCGQERRALVKNIIIISSGPLKKDMYACIPALCARYRGTHRKR